MNAGGVNHVGPVSKVEMTGGAPMLTYGRSRRSHWRWVRVALLLATGAVVVLAAWWAMPRLSMRTRVLGQQSALMGLSRPAETVVWEEETAPVTADSGGPARNGGYALRLIRRPGEGPDKTAAYLPEAPRAEFNAATGVQQWDFTAFAHARSGAGGKPRLVMVCGAVTTWTAKGDAGRAAGGPGESGRKVFLVPMVVEPGELTRAPRPAVRQAGTVGLDLHFDDTFRLYAGQPDPADGSRFTMDCECNGVRGTLEGTLAGDGAVRIKPTGRNPPRQPWHLDAMRPTGSKSAPPASGAAR